MKLGNDNIITKIKLSFTRNNRKSIKDVYLFLTNSTKDNLIDPNNVQYSMECHIIQFL